MIKCSICGGQVELRKENRYEVVIGEGALRKSFGFKDHLYEAFDCPHCGCQMLMNERFPVKNGIKITEGHADGYDSAEKEVIAAIVENELKGEDADNAKEAEWKDKMMRKFTQKV